MKKILLLTLLLVASTWIDSPLLAQITPSEINHAGIYKFDEALTSTFEDILHLRLQKAKIAIPAIKEKNPFNLLPYYIEDYIDFFHAFVDGNPKAVYGRYREDMEERLEWLAQGDESDPYFLYTQGDIYLRWGMIYALYGDNMEAFKSIKKAAKLLEKNAEKFPTFLPNKRALGILHTLVGSIPGEYKWGVSLVGLKGDINQGLGELAAVIDHGKTFPNFEFNQEVQLMYGILLLYMGNNDNTAWGALNTEVMDYTKNPMAAYILASRSIKTGKSQKAMLILQSVPEGDEYHYFGYIDILKGMTKLYRLDLDAEKDFKNFLEEYRGVNHIKEVYQKLAWVAILQKNEGYYNQNMRLVEKKGELNNFADRSAMNEMEHAKSGVIPNLSLLQARLLFDGGYYDKAYNILKKCDEKSLKIEEHQLEYTYRMARILHLMRKNEEALAAYTEVYEKGSKKPYYYACSAALKMGEIWEVRKEPTKAIDAYKKCLKEKPDQYKASLHAEAKANLAALDKKKK